MLIDQWDHCLSTLLIRSTLGASFGVIFSVLLFKRRAWPVWTGLGFGAGRAWEECDSVSLSPILASLPRSLFRDAPPLGEMLHVPYANFILDLHNIIWIIFEADDYLIELQASNSAVKRRSPRLAAISERIEGTEFEVPKRLVPYEHIIAAIGAL